MRQAASFVPQCVTLWTAARQAFVPGILQGKNTGAGCCVRRIFPDMANFTSAFGRRSLYHQHLPEARGPLHGKPSAVRPCVDGVSVSVPSLWPTFCSSYSRGAHFRLPAHWEVLFNCALRASVGRATGPDLGVLRLQCKPASTCEEGAQTDPRQPQPRSKSWRANARPPVSVWTVLGSTVTNSSRSSRNEPAFPTASQRTCLCFSPSPHSLLLSSLPPSPPSRLWLSDSGLGGFQLDLLKIWASPPA